MFERGKLTVVIGDSGAGKEYVVECYEKNRINVFINYENPPKKSFATTTHLHLHIYLFSRQIFSNAFSQKHLSNNYCYY